MNARALPPELAAGLRDEWSRFGVERAWLFGSRTKKTTADGSDWDFLVQFHTPPGFDTFMGLRASLQKRLNGHVDLLSRSACPPRFLDAILADLIDVT